MSRRVSGSIRLTDPVNGAPLPSPMAGEADHAIASMHATVTPALTGAGYAPSDLAGAMMGSVT